jgi:Ohr subfamily peroxiredoxin
LFARGYSACFLGALEFVAAKDEVRLPPDVSITGDVGIGPTPTGFGIAVAWGIDVPGMPREQAEALVQKARVACPYSDATRGTIDVRLVVV